MLDTAVLFGAVPACYKVLNLNELDTYFAMARGYQGKEGDVKALREQVNDSTTLNLIRKYLKAGVMENGLEKATITGVPQGGPLSVVCSNVYLDKLDKELGQRGLRFTRYADDGAPRRCVQVV